MRVLIVILAIHLRVIDNVEEENIENKRSRVKNTFKSPWTMS